MYREVLCTLHSFSPKGNILHDDSVKQNQEIDIGTINRVYSDMQIFCLVYNLSFHPLHGIFCRADVFLILLRSNLFVFPFYNLECVSPKLIHTAPALESSEVLVTKPICLGPTPCILNQTPQDGVC